MSVDILAEYTTRYYHLIEAITLIVINYRVLIRFKGAKYGNPADTSRLNQTIIINNSIFSFLRYIKKFLAKRNDDEYLVTTSYK